MALVWGVIGQNTFIVNPENNRCCIDNKFCHKLLDEANVSKGDHVKMPYKTQSGNDLIWIPGIIQEVEGFQVTVCTSDDNSMSRYDVNIHQINKISKQTYEKMTNKFHPKRKRKNNDTPRLTCRRPETRYSSDVNVIISNNVPNLSTVTKDLILDCIRQLERQKNKTQKTVIIQRSSSARTETDPTQVYYSNQNHADAVVIRCGDELCATTDQTFVFLLIVVSVLHAYYIIHGELPNILYGSANEPDFLLHTRFRLPYETLFNKMSQMSVKYYNEIMIPMMHFLNIPANNHKMTNEIKMMIRDAIMDSINPDHQLSEALKSTFGSITGRDSSNDLLCIRPSTGADTKDEFHVPLSVPSCTVVLDGASSHSRSVPNANLQVMVKMFQIELDLVTYNDLLRELRPAANALRKPSAPPYWRCIWNAFWSSVQNLSESTNSNQNVPQARPTTFLRDTPNGMNVVTEDHANARPTYQVNLPQTNAPRALNDRLQQFRVALENGTISQEKYERFTERLLENFSNV